MNNDMKNTARLIDGKAAGQALRNKIGVEVDRLHQKTGRSPGLAVILVGSDPASEVYVNSKLKATKAAGMRSFEFKLPAETTTEAILELLAQLNADAAVSGILVQLPLPKHIDADLVIDAIDLSKDVDGFHVANSGRLSAGRPALVPCTPLGCLMLLKQELGDLSGLEAVIIGRSNIVGKPMAQLLLQQNATVTVAHSRTRDLAAVARRADIIVAAVGKARLVDLDFVKPDATVIDVGINRIVEDNVNKLVGDVDFTAVRQVAGAITPVPGGVGPMTIACLLLNTVFAFCDQNGLERPQNLAL